MNWRNVLIVLLSVSPLLILLGIGFRLNPRAVPSVMVGKPAPSCALETLQGKALTMEELRGKPVLMNFWSTWCVPCESEHHLLQRTAQRWGEDVQFVGVVYQDEPRAARRYLERNGSAYLQALDPQSRCSIDYGVSGVPETFFIGADGIVKHKEVGPVTPRLLDEQLKAITAGEQS